MFSLHFIINYWTQFFAVFTATLGSISNGMEYGWASPAVPILKTSGREINITHDESYWIESMYIFGAISGVPVTFSLLQFFGRARSLAVAGLLSLISWILIATANTVEQIYVARFLSGLGSNIAYVGIPMYSAEISQPKIRGFVGTLISSMSLLGVLISYSVVPYVPIYASCIVGAAVAFLQIATYPFRPESPYYLLLKNKPKEAMSSLKRLRHDHTQLKVEMEEISAAVQRQKSERGRPVDLVLSRSNRKASIIMTCLNIAQNMSGSTVIVMNVQSVLHSAQTSLSPELSAIFYSLAMLVASLVGILLIDKFGRKILLITSSLLTTLFLALLSAFFYVKDIQQVDTTDYKWVPLFCMIAYAFCFKYGMGQVPIVVSAELFPTSVKTMGMVLSDLWFTVVANISIKVYYATIASYGMYFPFMIFAVFAITNAVFVFFYIPETKGKSLEQIQMILKGKNWHEVDEKVHVETG